MSSKRPLFSKSIAELEELVAEKQGDPQSLARVMAELSHRETDRAAKLRNRVKAIQDGLELDLPQPDPNALAATTVSREDNVPLLEFSQPGNIAAPYRNRAELRQRLRDARVKGHSECPETGNTPDPALIEAPKASPDHKSSPEPIAPIEAADPLVVSRMFDLIDYVISVEKDKLKLVTDVADHRAFNRSNVQLDGLPGVHFNSVDGDEVAWLKVERLAKTPPPEPDDETLKPWAILFDDPAKQPRLRESLGAAEARLAKIELEPDQKSVVLHDFDSRTAVEKAFASYLGGPWTTWKEQETPRRETIALYSSLFALQAALTAPDGAPQEFVCGIGYAALTRAGKRLNYPLLTVPLDIELDHKSHVISVVPREEVSPSIETDPLDVLELNQVDAWRKDARRILDSLDDSPLSPFAPETYDAILRQATALLDPQARYLDGTGEIVPPPTPGTELIVSSAFGFFQRERRATQLMADLLNFRGLLEDDEAPVEIPGAIAALFTEPSSNVADENYPTFRGINSIPGITSSDGEGADLFFPKPFNGEQVQIAQRLAVRDGVVVQGPPGTGKTHTIANIISHYLATGRRVLVTSQKTPALQVLQEQLPAPIRPLAVSLLDSDREGLRQFRASVDLIAERLQNLRRSEIDSEIVSLENRIDGLHRTLAKLDHQIEQLGRNALQSVKLDDQAISPLDAAKEVLDAGEDAWWIEDAITPDPRHSPTFNDDDIANCRLARKALGESLDYLGKPLPPADLFADIEALVSTHSDLAQAAAIRREIKSGALWSLVDETPETLEAVAVQHERLSAWTMRRDALSSNAPSWDRALETLLVSPSDPLLHALRALRDDANELADDHAWLMTRPVELPAEAVDDPRFLSAVEDLQVGGQGLGGLAGLFARRTKQYLSEVRLRGKPPQGVDDWQAVARHIRSHERAAMFAASWNHACTASDVPSLSSTGPAAGREAMRVLDRLDELVSLHAEAAVLTKEIRKLLPEWNGSVERRQDMGSTIHCLKLHLDRARLAKAEATCRQLFAAIGPHATGVHEDARALVSSFGTEDLSPSECREQVIALSRRIEHLHRMRPHFDTINEVAAKVSTSGAPKWASQLCSAPAIGEDIWCPSDWRRRWRLRQLASWLDASQKLDAFQTLHNDRQNAESDLSRAYTRLIEQRTWRELKKQASPAVMTALSAYAVAVGRIGKGTGKSANRHRKTARQAANAVKGALPCWIMPHHRVSESLPAELGIFDLVIVDEASQSTLAALPALFRARQILVVGDDKQVSPDHVGLAMDQANARAARYLASQVPLFQAPMREEASLYDLASVIFGGDNLMLREHFRCSAPIIEFSKRQFYRDELRPLRLSKSSERLDPVLIDVRVTDGYRKGKTNPPEADYIVNELRRMGDDPAFDGRSFGVTTLLGNEQAALIYKRIEGELGIPFIEKFHVRVGDPSAFQGDERDVMFLSMVVTAGNATALSGLGYEQRFNVAASRARERMILVRSIELDQLSPRDALRRAILEHFRSPFPADASDLQDARGRCESDFEREMFDLLVERGYCVDTQVKVGAHRIDMVVEGDEDRRLAIECDGDRYHGPEQWPSDMARQRTLERAGWRIWRCFASRFVREKAKVVEELTELLSTLDIQPRSGEERSRAYTELREWNSSSSDNAAGETIANDDEIGIECDPSAGELTKPAQVQPVARLLNSAVETIDDAAVEISELPSSPSANTAQRVTEADVQAAILKLLGNGAVWTNSELKQALSNILPLSSDDRQRSKSRPNEEKWEELVNNALTRTGRSNSLYARGLVSKVGFGRHRLADREGR